MKLINKTKYDSRQLKAFIGRAMKSELGKWDVKSYTVTVGYKTARGSSVRAYKKRPAFTLLLPKDIADFRASILLYDIKQATNYTVSGSWKIRLVSDAQAIENGEIVKMPITMRPEPKKKERPEFEIADRKLAQLKREAEDAAKKVAEWEKRLAVAAVKLKDWRAILKRRERRFEQAVVDAREKKPKQTFTSDREISFDNI